MQDSDSAFTLASWPTAVMLKTDATNGWGIYKLEICDGICGTGSTLIVLKDPKGSGGRKYGDNGYWLDSPDYPEIEWSVPALGKSAWIL